MDEIVKKCKKCLRNLQIANFRKYRCREKYIYFSSWCKDCNKKYVKEYYRLNRETMYRKKQLYLKNNPWAKTLNGIITRVGKQYRKFGIKNYLIVQNLRFLWLRDRAYLMKKPVIHRIDNLGDYTLGNCKYVELKEHLKIHSRKGQKRLLWRYRDKNRMLPESLSTYIGIGRE
ncbi:MAG: hypothetical protein AB1349_10355 [Elusimicrobiota bacterium]